MLASFQQAESVSVSVPQESATLTLDQQQQLSDAHAALLLRLHRLAEDRKPQTAMLQSIWPAGDCQAQNLVMITKVESPLDVLSAIVSSQLRAGGLA